MITQAPAKTPVVDENGHVTPAWLSWFGVLFDYYQNILRWADPQFDKYGTYEATYKVVRVVAYADGTNWDPQLQGCPGYYEWDGTEWRGWENEVYNLNKKLAVVDQGTWVTEIEKRLHRIEKVLAMVQPDNGFSIEARLLQIEKRLTLIEVSNQFDVDNELLNAKKRLAMAG